MHVVWFARLHQTVCKTQLINSFENTALRKVNIPTCTRFFFCRALH